MGSRLIKLTDGTLVEIAVRDDEEEISNRAAQAVNSTLEKIKPVLLNVCQPVVEVWQELNKEMQIEQAEVEIGFSFEGEGNIYVTKAKASSNIKVKLVLKPKAE